MNKNVNTALHRSLSIDAASDRVVNQVKSTPLSLFEYHSYMSAEYGALFAINEILSESISIFSKPWQYVTINVISNKTKP